MMFFVVVFLSKFGFLRVTDRDLELVAKNSTKLEQLDVLGSSHITIESVEL